MMIMNEIDWYTKLLQLAKDKEFEKKQLEYFPFETDLPLKTIKKAFEASLEKEDPCINCRNAITLFF